MGKLQARFEGLNRRTLIRVGLPLQVLLRLDGTRRQTGQSRDEVFEEAVEDWTRRNRRSLTRQRRLALEKQLSMASDGVSIDQLAEDFLADSEEEPGHSSRGRKSVGAVVYANQMLGINGMTQLKARRLSVGLTQDELAELAGCSRGAIRLYESGSVPQKSKVLKLIERALTDAEREIS